MTASALKHRATDPATSRRAAKLAEPKQPSQKQKILAEVAGSLGGLNYDEISERTGIVGVSVSTRLSELARAGLIVESGTRETRAGGLSTVWRALDAGSSSGGNGGATVAAAPPVSVSAAAAVQEPAERPLPASSAPGGSSRTALPTRPGASHVQLDLLGAVA